jgi:hypothetical protein
MGGMTNFKEAVAVDSQVFILRDTQDRLWNIETHQLLTAEEVAKVETIYADMFKANNTPQVAEQMEEQWEEFLGASSNSSITAQSVNSFATSEGSLDLKRVKAYVEGQNAEVDNGEIQAQIVNPPTRSCFLFVCQGIRTGTLPMANNVQRGAYFQDASQLGRPRGQTFNFITCATNNPVQSDVVGCAPMAFIGLIEWYADRGYYFSTVKNPIAGVPSYRTVAYNMTAPTGFNGRPLIAGYMRSCSTGPDGVLTTGGAFRDGGRTFLTDQGSSLRMVSNISHYTGNTYSAIDKANILIRNVGNNNRPVIAEYFTGFLKGHFSPVVDYAVYDLGTKGLNIRTVGDLELGDTKWYSLSGTWGTERGVFALE